MEEVHLPVALLPKTEGCGNILSINAFYYRSKARIIFPYRKIYTHTPLCAVGLVKMISPSSLSSVSTFQFSTELIF